jgi:hypothetical protein
MACGFRLQSVALCRQPCMAVPCGACCRCVCASAAQHLCLFSVWAACCCSAARLRAACLALIGARVLQLYVSSSLLPAAAFLCGVWPCLFRLVQQRFAAGSCAFARCLLLLLTGRFAVPQPLGVLLFGCFPCRVGCGRVWWARGRGLGRQLCAARLRFSACCCQPHIAQPRQPQPLAQGQQQVPQQTHSIRSSEQQRVQLHTQHARAQPPLQPRGQLRGPPCTPVPVSPPRRPAPQPRAVASARLRRARSAGSRCRRSRCAARGSCAPAVPWGRSDRTLSWANGES